MTKHIELSRSACRGCGRTELSEVLSLGDVAVSDFLVDAEQAACAPLVLAICNPDEGGCSLVQLAHKALPRDMLYRRYWYRSGTNESMRAALADIVSSAEQMVHLRSGDLVIDIGANDGTLLQAYRSPGIHRVGFEPALNISSGSHHPGMIMIQDYFSSTALEDHVVPGARARIVTAIAMFYDLDDPHLFLNDVAKVLHEDGIFIIQMAYLPTMLSQNNFDNICHEHVAYYSLGSLERLLQANGLVVRDVDLNDVNGGSFRVYIQHANSTIRVPAMSGAEQRLNELRSFETDRGLTSLGTYVAFEERIDRIKIAVNNYVNHELSLGKRVHGYGASTKGNTLLQHFGLGAQQVEMIAERSSTKWGRRTAGTDIPIVSETKSRRNRPDCYIVLPWHFRDSMLVRENSYLAAGGAMLFPLPHPVIVRMSEGKLVTQELSLE